MNSLKQMDQHKCGFFSLSVKTYSAYAEQMMEISLYSLSDCKEWYLGFFTHFTDLKNSLQHISLLSHSVTLPSAADIMNFLEWTDPS